MVIFCTAMYFSSGKFGRGSGAIHLDDVQCVGSESMLMQCPHTSMDNCAHFEDVGLRCESCDCHVISCSLFIAHPSPRPQVLNVKREQYDCKEAPPPIRAEWRCVLEEDGAQCVTMDGAPMTPL